MTSEDDEETECRVCGEIEVCDRDLTLCPTCMARVERALDHKEEE